MIHGKCNWSLVGWAKREMLCKRCECVWERARAGTNLELCRRRAAAKIFFFFFFPRPAAAGDAQKMRMSQTKCLFCSRPQNCHSKRLVWINDPLRVSDFVDSFAKSFVFFYFCRTVVQKQFVSPSADFHFARMRQLKPTFLLKIQNCRLKTMRIGNPIS